MHHLDSHNILLDTQFGFRSHQSSESQLLLTIDDFVEIAINNIQQIDISILKAFDNVRHLRLLQPQIRTLWCCGKHSDLVNYISLLSRSQQVALNGVLSSPVKVTSGVPQGSVLGPIRFLVYINDIAAGIQSNL